MDAVKVHRPRDWASRGDDLGVKHRNTFCTFCRCHRDRGRFDQVWEPATGLSSGLGRGDTIAAIELGALPTRDLNPVGLLLAHRRNPARTTVQPLPHAGPNPKYFGVGSGVTYYDLTSNQFTGLNGIVVPGTLRDSLVLFAVVPEQQTELQPTQIMTDTGAYSDVVFGLFRLLGYRFSPWLADIRGTCFWRNR